jgi:hypothetical protein
MTIRIKELGYKYLFDKCQKELFLLPSAPLKGFPLPSFNTTHSKSIIGKLFLALSMYIELIDKSKEPDHLKELGFNTII